tara:strand:+ start:3333 stop:4214 length:882 start_codon:yes stop_codon:yes gene_type:complete
MKKKISTWQIGKIKITRIIEGERAGPMFVLPDATPENIIKMPWLQPYFSDSDGNTIVSIHALIVETPDKCIMVDTCLGNDKERHIPQWNMLQTRFLEDLERSGYSAEKIDTVLCTHMHTDHVGWNTVLVNNKWEPTFKNADYLFGRKEWDHTEKQLDNPAYAEFINDSIIPIINSGLVKFIEMDEEICDGINLEPTAGHTPGHVSVKIESEGKKAAITGDFLHHPCQMEKLEWESVADWDKELAKETRKNKLEEYANENILVFGTHFATPAAGYVKHKKNHFVYEVKHPDNAY